MENSKLHSRKHTKLQQRGLLAGLRYSLDKHTGSHEPLCENSKKSEKPCRVLHHNFVCQPLQMCVRMFGPCSDPINRAHVCPSKDQCSKIQQRTQWAKRYGCKQNYIHLNYVQLAPFGFLRFTIVRGFTTVREQNTSNAALQLSGSGSGSSRSLLHVTFRSN